VKDHLTKSIQCLQQRLTPAVLWFDPTALHVSFTVVAVQEALNELLGEVFRQLLSLIGMDLVWNGEKNVLSCGREKLSRLEACLVERPGHTNGDRAPDTAKGALLGNRFRCDGIQR
jgi:hypothetical protein